MNSCELSFFIPLVVEKLERIVHIVFVCYQKYHNHVILCLYVLDILRHAIEHRYCVKDRAPLVTTSHSRFWDYLLDYVFDKFVRRLVVYPSVYAPTNCVAGHNVSVIFVAVAVLETSELTYSN